MAFITIGISLACVDVNHIKSEYKTKNLENRPSYFFTKMYVYHDTVKSFGQYYAHTLPNHRWKFGKNFIALEAPGNIIQGSEDCLLEGVVEGPEVNIVLLA